MFQVIGLTQTEVNAALAHLWRLRAANRQAMGEIFSSDGETIRGILADVTDQVSERASQLAPWLTGTLASAHRSRIESGASQLTGVVYIDPTVVNPVFGGYPAIYGGERHQYDPWFAWTVLEMQDQVQTLVPSGIQIKLKEIYG